MFLLVFHVEHSEAYSATGKIHLRQQAENQKEHVV